MVSLLKGIKQQGGVAVSFWFYDTPVVFIAVWLVPDDRCDSTSKLAGLVLVRRSRHKQHTRFKLNRCAAVLLSNESLCFQTNRYA